MRRARHAVTRRTRGSSKRGGVVIVLPRLFALAGCAQAGGDAATGELEALKLPSALRPKEFTAPLDKGRSARRRPGSMTRASRSSGRRC
jgi:hypothetical protein